MSTLAEPQEGMHATREDYWHFATEARNNGVVSYGQCARKRTNTIELSLDRNGNCFSPISIIWWRIKETSEGNCISISWMQTRSPMERFGLATKLFRCLIERFPDMEARTMRASASSRGWLIKNGFTWDTGLEVWRRPVSVGQPWRAVAMEEKA